MFLIMATVVLVIIVYSNLFKASNSYIVYRPTYISRVRRGEKLEDK
ncbi:hypothetical protein Patl1_09429 [Pistacia atlantica]|uniref:Uncharacterized protein n=1 Tax=Pistacia atlantica TaxID=434234 RepID=A0ACC1AG14_9ROSI|nr:hypothetical protein Patl1_09429 [Pistacia atlantica]